MGGPQCRVSILRNSNVACLCLLFSPMSRVEFKERLCPMSLKFHTPCRMSLSHMSHVEFKKSPCRHVDFRGQGPYKTAVRYYHNTAIHHVQQYWIVLLHISSLMKFGGTPKWRGGCVSRGGGATHSLGVCTNCETTAPSFWQWTAPRFAMSTFTAPSFQRSPRKAL